jgi:hypothetical protein
MAEIQPEASENGQPTPATAIGHTVVNTEAERHFPLQSLPPEVLRRVLEYALPQGMIFGFMMRKTKTDTTIPKEPQWVFWAMNDGCLVSRQLSFYEPLKVTPKSKLTEIEYADVKSNIQFSRLHVNRYFTAECRGE